MPKGFDGLRKASAEIEARKAAGGGGGFYFKLPNSGDVAHGRFLEGGEDIEWAYVHEVPVEGRQWGDDVPCLDQEKEDKPCPGCERNLKRKVKVWVNIIWRDGPVYKKDADNKLVKENNQLVIVDRKDQVAIWSSGITLFNNLEEVDENWGVTTRDYKIKRKGSGLETKYVITPADPDGGKKEMSAADKELAANKHDLTQFSKPPSYDEFAARLGGSSTGASSNGPASDENTTTAPPNPFINRR